MGTDNLFHKRKVTRQKRKSQISNYRKTQWLIVCEGSSTEPNYIKGLTEFLKTTNGGDIDIKYGDGGRNTKGLIDSIDRYFDATDKLIRDTRIPYKNDRIVFLFDKDSFKKEQFNTAIQMATKRFPGCIVAWSNESFELWIRLHFDFANTSQTRHQHNDWITKKFRTHNIFTNNQNYEDNGKNLKDIFDSIIKLGGSIDNAIRNAKRLVKGKDLSKPANANPVTMVFKIVEKLIEESKQADK